MLGTDIDPQAIEAANYNAEVNQADARFYLPEQMPEGKFVLWWPIFSATRSESLQPALLGRVKSGGHLVLSGILERQADELIEVYRSYLP